MPELEGKKYSYDKKGMGQYKKDLAKKGYKPQTTRAMNGYVPQSQMTDEQLSQKAYGSMGMPQVQIMNQAIKRMKMQQMQQMMVMQEAMNQKKAEGIAVAVDGVLSENVQLKKQINLNEIQLEKSNTINKARQKPVDITKKRTGK